MSLISNNICGLLLFCFLIQIDACARTRPPNRTSEFSSIFAFFLIIIEYFSAVAPTTAGTTVGFLLILG